MNTYRVFISYSHKDRALVEKIAHILEKNGLSPVWDKHILEGEYFHDRIKSLISHSHVFMPVITPASSKRGWVHQEIGYAMALNIPVLPISIGSFQGAMLQQILAVTLDEALSDAESRLTYKVFDNLVKNFSNPSFALYHCADDAETRARMMAEYANEVINCEFYGHVRQKGGLSSFHIPNKSFSNPAWADRYLPNIKSDSHIKGQFEERIALERHAVEEGCSLIVFPEWMHYVISENYSPAAQLARFGELVEFLESMPDDKVCIAMDHNMKNDESITILGDWFVAEAVSRSASQGYRQSIFTRHAPSIFNRISLFDREIEELLRKDGWTRSDSRRRAITYLNGIIASIPK